jgi:hypothetical protein
MNRFAAKLKSDFVRLFIRETLAVRTLDCKRRTFSVVVAECGSGVVPEIKFGKIAVQMFFFAMLIDTAHSALEDREIAFR